MDDLMPNDGGAAVFQPEVDEATEKELNEERAMVQTAGPLLQRYLDFFDEQIAGCSDIDSIQLTSGTPTDDVRVQLLVQKTLKNALRACKADLENLKDAHSR